jgi:FkbM family methyltransferase
MLVNTKDMGITPHLIMDGFWEMHITSLFERVIQEGFTVIDIGANMGYYTLVAAQRVGKTGRVYAFEPEPNNYDILCKNIAINGFRPIVTACQKALLDKQGEVNFTVYEESPGGSSVFMSNSTFVNRPARKKTISVQTTTLDTFLADNLKVDIMKIDAEGAEPLIFKGMKNIIKNSPTLKIIMEFAPTHIEAAGENPRDFLWSLKNMGFKIKLVDRNSGQLSEVEIGSLLKCEIEDLFLDKVVV